MTLIREQHRADRPRNDRGQVDDANPLKRSGHGSVSFSPGFRPRPQVEFVRPGIALLGVQHPVILSDRLRIEDLFRRLPTLITIRRAGPGEVGVDRAIHDDMRDMDALGPKFPGHALRQSSQRMFAAREGGVTGTAADRRGRTGEQDRAAPSGGTMTRAASRPFRKPASAHISHTLV